mmetsp:Transcript_6533/g.13956  ORF Transcript_6533/g.13956 Transcript_6533/m.13956 type:complete len:88 (-) Transcript_6533:501-764(-)
MLDEGLLLVCKRAARSCSGSVELETELLLREPDAPRAAADEIEEDEEDEEEDDDDDEVCRRVREGVIERMKSSNVMSGSPSNDSDAK